MKESTLRNGGGQSIYPTDEELFRKVIHHTNACTEKVLDTEFTHSHS